MSTRRTFLRNTLGAMGSVAAIVWLSGCKAIEDFFQSKDNTVTPDPGEQLSPVSEDDPTAKSVGYRHLASNVDSRKFPANARKNQDCLNCNFYIPSAKIQGWGGCRVIPAGLVDARGWCKMWGPRI